jgi:hypothetical protein
VILKIKTEEMNFEFDDPTITYSGYSIDGANPGTFIKTISEIIQKVTNESLKLKTQIYEKN